MTNAAQGVVPIGVAEPGMIDGAGQIDVGQRIVDGYRCLDRFEHRQALEQFGTALGADPSSRDAQLGYNQVIQRVVPRWHFAMMNDRERNDAYDAAIRGAVAGKTVLDVGAGSGLLAMMAARAGAKHVYTCEMCDPIAAVAQRVVEQNGFGDRISVFAKKSDDLEPGVDIPEPVDVLVTETLDSALLGEGIVPIILDARRRLMRKDALVIPRRARMFAALLDSREVWEMNCVDEASGFDVGLFNDLSTDGFYPVRLKRFEHAFASESFALCDFDFMNDPLEPRELAIPVTASSDGTCHAMAYWYELELDDRASFSTTPDNFDSHWKQAVQCFADPIEVRAGQRFTLNVAQGSTRFDFELVPA